LFDLNIDGLLSHLKDIDISKRIGVKFEETTPKEVQFQPSRESRFESKIETKRPVDN